MGETKTVKGRFDGKRVILLDEPPTREPCEVAVTFGTRGDDEEARRRFLAARGSWVDDRSTDEIIAEIVGSRSMGRKVPEL